MLLPIFIFTSAFIGLIYGLIWSILKFKDKRVSESDIVMKPIFGFIVGFCVGGFLYSTIIKYPYAGITILVVIILRLLISYIREKMIN